MDDDIDTSQTPETEPFHPRNLRALIPSAHHQSALSIFDRPLLSHLPHGPASLSLGRGFRSPYFYTIGKVNSGLLRRCIFPFTAHPGTTVSISGDSRSENELGAPGAEVVPWQFALGFD